jgi:hypothetical protein
MKQYHWWGLVVVISIILGTISGCNNLGSQELGQQTKIPDKNETPTFEPLRSNQTSAIILSKSENTFFTSPILPKLWSRISKLDITVYPYDHIEDYVYTDDGSLWMVGGFGVLHRLINGVQTLYSIQNGLPRQFFTRVAISPSGEVWIGGTDNALFRFTGKEWVNEGDKLPNPYDDRTEWLCYSKNIAGIDFSPDGSTWVMNGGIEIYRQAYGQWVNIPFPKEILPDAGGGACPIGFRVASDDDITIMRSGCCMGSPEGYHFNGKEWKTPADYSSVEELLMTRHRAKLDDFYSLTLGGIYSKSSLFTDYLSSYMFQPLPFFFYPSRYRDIEVTSDSDGVIWINDGFDLYNNSSGKFDDLMQPLGDGGAKSSWPEDAELNQSVLINFGKNIFLYQDERNAQPLERQLRISGIIDMDETPDKDSTRIIIGKNNQLWILSRQQGLLLLENGKLKEINKIPKILALSQFGDTLLLPDGRIWVGSTGGIWEYNNGEWNRYIIPDTEELISHFIEQNNGYIYGATNSSVYLFNNNSFTVMKFVTQHKRVFVEENENDCSFHKYYTSCQFPRFDNPSENQYKFVYLGISENGSLIFINNRLVAKREGGIWKSYFFDTFEIDSATIDKNGFIWIFSESDGLFRLSPDIFKSI